tara:strand:- start:571 stop:1173 length:603 start_codon:yes stop_codon:yes gene_type:complete
MTINNLELWHKVEKTNPKYTKAAKIGGMNITAIAPQYQIMLATEQFGPYGKGFGFRSIELDYSLIEVFKLVVFKGVFFYSGGEFTIINSSKMYMDRNEKMVDADFAKKIETDALTKALSKLGFNADVFMGRFDDHKYVAEINAEFNPPTPKIDIVAIAGECGWTLEQVVKSFNNSSIKSIKDVQDLDACAAYIRSNRPCL